MATTRFCENSSDTLSSNLTPNCTNGSAAGTYEDPFKWTFEFSVILACIFSVSAFCTVVGNIMVLMVIIRHRGMRTRTNLFLLNLAIADLLVGLFMEPFSITTLIQNKWIFGQELCMLNGWMNGFCLITSFHTLMYISIHKYFSIVRPLSNPLKLTYIIVMMIAAWLWAAICSTLNIFLLVVEYKPGTSQCGPRYPNSATAFMVHGLIQLSVIYLPALILVFCYFRIFRAIKKHSKRLRENSTVEEAFILSQQKKVTKTLFIVLATFVMMALPYHIYAMYITIEVDKEHFPSVINPLAYMFLYLNSMCNPIIYAFRSPAFREGYKEILCQTPNYVISDESDQVPRARRLSSLIPSLRRGNSVRSCSKKVRPNADGPTMPSKHTAAGEMPPKFYRQKSLLELLRSSRQSDAQSVVQRNGDIIIMKGGKIVSVRKGEGNPFLGRLKTFAETNQRGRGLAAGLAGTGHVIFGLVCDSIGEGESHQSVHGQNDLLEIASNGLNSQTECPEIQTGEKVSNTSGVNVDIGNESSMCKEDQDWAFKSVNTNGLTSFGTTLTANGLNERRKGPAFGINLASYNEKKSTAFKPVAKKLSCTKDSMSGGLHNLQQPSRRSCVDEPCADDGVSSLHSGGVVIHVGDDDDVLSVMPLTPNTKEYLAKSDMYISQIQSGASQAFGETFLFKALQISHSCEHVLRRPTGIQRLPSLEFLDPPVHLFRSRSNIGVHSSVERLRGSSKLHKKSQSSQSSDVSSQTKSSHLRSAFSPRHQATHL